MTIPFNPRDNNIVISVSFHSHITSIARLAFDTGASVTTIPKEMTTYLHLKMIRTIEATSVSKIEKVPIVIIPRVSIGNEELKNVEAIVKDLPPQSQVDGLLGLNVIKHVNVNIDFKHGKLILQKNS